MYLCVRHKVTICLSDFTYSRDWLGKKNLMVRSTVIRLEITLYFLSVFSRYLSLPICRKPLVLCDQVLYCPAFQSSISVAMWMSCILSSILYKTKPLLTPGCFQVHTLKIWKVSEIFKWIYYLSACCACWSKARLHTPEHTSNPLSLKMKLWFVIPWEFGFKAQHYELTNMLVETCKFGIQTKVILKDSHWIHGKNMLSLCSHLYSTIFPNPLM